MKVIVVKDKNGKLIHVSQVEELTTTDFVNLTKQLELDEREREQEKKCLVEKVSKLSEELSKAIKCITELQKPCIKDFLGVFGLFKAKVIGGELEIEDENILKLDDLVLSGELLVEEAYSKHEFLKRALEKGTK